MYSADNKLPVETEKGAVEVSGRSSDVSASVQQQQQHIVDPYDPLQWSWRKKNSILFAVCYLTLISDFLAAFALPMVIPQAKDWGISVTDACRSLSGNALMQGFGSLAAVPFTQRFGVLPVMFWSSMVTVILSVAGALCPGWIGFIAVRSLQGFSGAAPQVLGMTVIQDVFQFEEHARKLGIWGWAVLIGPYFGPFIGSLVLETQTWRVGFWVLTGIIAIGFILVVFVMEETSYDRINRFNNPTRHSTPWKAHALCLAGVYGYRAKGRKTLLEGCVEVWTVFSQPQFFLIFIYHGFTFMWTLGLNGTLMLFLNPPEPAGYGFGNLALGLVYFTPMTAIILGELWGHFFNDFLQTRHLRKHSNNFQPEARLSALYFSALLMAPSLLLFGYGLQNHWPWPVLIFSWGLFVFAAMTSTVSISAYTLDNFPQNSAAASALLAFTRVLCGSMVPLFQLRWVKDVGAVWTFGAQAAVCTVAFLAVVPVLQVFGVRWRVRSGGVSPEVIRADDCESEDQ